MIDFESSCCKIPHRAVFVVPETNRLIVTSKTDTGFLGAMKARIKFLDLYIRLVHMIFQVKKKSLQGG